MNNRRNPTPLGKRLPVMFVIVTLAVRFDPSIVFIEVFVDTPLDVCESRDVKGIYAQARKGAIMQFTGVDDAYEKPLAAEITMETTACSAEENAARVIDVLRERGYVR